MCDHHPSPARSITFHPLLRDIKALAFQFHVFITFSISVLFLSAGYTSCVLPLAAASRHGNESFHRSGSPPVIKQPFATVRNSSIDNIKDTNIQSFLTEPHSSSLFVTKRTPALPSTPWIPFNNIIACPPPLFLGLVFEHNILVIQSASAYGANS
jgi:hypothetical protein